MLATDAKALAVTRRFIMLLVHMRRAQVAPVDAHRSLRHVIDRGNGKSGILGLRIMYCFAHAGVDG